jgi:hypothetical protein
VGCGAVMRVFGVRARGAMRGAMRARIRAAAGRALGGWGRGRGWSGRGREDSIAHTRHPAVSVFVQEMGLLKSGLLVPPRRQPMMLSPSLLASLLISIGWGMHCLLYVERGGWATYVT